MTQEQIIDADKILESFKSDEERIRAGWVSPEEMDRFNISKDRVIGLLNEHPFEINGEWPNLIFIKGSIEIPEGGKVDLPQCQSVSRKVTVYKNATLNLPQCQSVDWDVIVNKNATLNLPQCQSVGWDVIVDKNATLNLSQCQSIGRNVVVGENATLNLSQCQSIGRNVLVSENVILDLPQCQSVGESVVVGENTTLNLSQCQCVGGSVTVYENVTLDISQCQSVGRNVIVYENATIDLPQCQSVGGGVYVDKNATLNSPQCQSVDLGVCDRFGNPLPQYNDIKPDSFYFNCLKRDISLKVINPFMFVIRNEDDRRYLDRIMEMKADPQRVVDFRLEDQKAFLDRMCSKIGDKIHAAGLPDDLSVTDVKVNSLPYADGKPLCECPGWGEERSDYGRVESVTICDGNGCKSVFSGNMIDKEGNITLEVNNASVTFNLKTGRAKTALKPSGILEHKAANNISQSKGAKLH